MRFLKLRHSFKKVLVWMKSHWELTLAVLSFIIISAVSRNKTRSLTMVLDETKKLYNNEIDVINLSYESQIESILDVEKKRKEALERIEEKYKLENKSFDKKKRKEVENVLKENLDDPGAITKRLSDITGFDIVL
ncbi:hypothetical protein CMI47_18895 [Candidatus Pacearchaeota archaeon]|nr:hypothetical protein [Candidatus Pacearchaeota archaeon]|tara:strand:+ start:50 stop:454 length:405 start_codon:yes stop_codon:yes gene_type:complete